MYPPDDWTLEAIPGEPCLYTGVPRPIQQQGPELGFTRDGKVVVLDQDNWHRVLPGAALVDGREVEGGVDVLGKDAVRDAVRRSVDPDSDGPRDGESGEGSHEGLVRVMRGNPAILAAVGCIVDDLAAVRCALQRDPALAKRRLEDGWMLILDAAMFGSVETVRLLAASGANPSAQASNGRTALHYAAAGGHLAVAKALVVELGARVDVLDNDLASPSHLAAGRGDLTLLMMLLREGRAFSGLLPDRFGRNCEQLLEGLQPPQIWTSEMTYLARAGLSQPDGSGFTALHRATRQLNLFEIRALLAVGANPEVRTAAAGATALCVLGYAEHGPEHAAAVGRAEREEKEAAAAAATTTTTTTTTTVAAVAAAGGSVSPASRRASSASKRRKVSAGSESSARRKIIGDHRRRVVEEARVARVLLDHGADPRSCPENGMSPLHLAAQHGNDDVAIMLLEAGADRHSVDARGRTPFVVAKQAGWASLALMLSPMRLVEAAESFDAPLVETLLSLSAPVEGDAGEAQPTPLQAAVARAASMHPIPEEALATVAVLVKNGATVSGPPVGPIDQPLHMACACGDPALLALVLGGAGADPGRADRHGLPALMRLPYGRSRAPIGELIRMLLGRGADPHQPNPTGNTALHFAAKAGDREACKALAIAGARDRPRLDGSTAEDIATGAAKPYLAELRAAAVAAAAPIAQHRITLILSVAERDDEYELEKDDEEEEEEKQRQKQQQQQQPTVAEEVVVAKEPVKEEEGANTTASVVDEQKSKSASPEPLTIIIPIPKQADEDDSRSPAAPSQQQAQQQQQQQAPQPLRMSAAALVRPAAPRLGETPEIHRCILARNVARVKLILEGVPKIGELLDETGRPALHLALQLNLTNVGRMLLDAGASPDVVNHEGKTPLHVMVTANNREAVDLLLEHGADPTRRDGLGQTPLTLAKHYGYHDLAERLSPENPAAVFFDRVYGSRDAWRHALRAPQPDPIFLQQATVGTAAAVAAINPANTTTKSPRAAPGGSPGGSEVPGELKRLLPPITNPAAAIPPEAAIRVRQRERQNFTRFVDGRRRFVEEANVSLYDMPEQLAAAPSAFVSTTGPTLVARPPRISARRPRARNGEGAGADLHDDNDNDDDDDDDDGGEGGGQRNSKHKINTLVRTYVSNRELPPPLSKRTLHGYAIKALTPYFAEQAPVSVVDLAARRAERRNQASRTTAAGRTAPVIVKKVK
jgi:ankyrin repeat protein